MGYPPSDARPARVASQREAGGTRCLSLMRYPPRNRTLRGGWLER